MREKGRGENTGERAIEGYNILKLTAHAWAIESGKKNRGETGATALNREREMIWKRAECFGKGWREKENKQKQKQKMKR